MTSVTWRTSSYSPSSGGNCVEAGVVADGSGRVAVRDSKDRSGPMLMFSCTDWAAFLTTTKH